jgi:hypothetical protein
LTPVNRLVWRMLGNLLLLSLLVACASQPAEPPSPTPPPVLQSAWGETILIDQAEQTRAPALLSLDERRFFASWVDTDPNGLAQFSRTWVDFSPSVRLLNGDPRPAIYAHSQTLLPADGDLLHLLWLDADPAESLDATRLWSVTLRDDLQAERGQIRLSDRRTAHYSAVATDDNAVWVVWSGGLHAEPSLHSQFIDQWGRPAFSDSIIATGDFPALVFVEGRLTLFWISVPDGRVYQATLQEGRPEAIRMITPSVRLQPGDRLVSFHAGADATQVTLFWNIVRADGEFQTWMTSNRPGAEQWPPPAQMRITISDQPYETGFNGGAGQQAALEDDSLSGVSLSWTAPMPGQFDTLVVAAQVEDALAVVYLRGGDVVGYQRVASLAQPGLIGLPTLATDRNRHLYLAWSQPTDDGFAHLYLTTTR